MHHVRNNTSCSRVIKRFTSRDLQYIVYRSLRWHSENIDSKRLIMKHITVYILRYYISIINNRNKFLIFFTAYFQRANSTTQSVLI